jgi:hemerythrin
MSVIQWQESYSVGVPFIDADHQILISLLNQLFEAREEGQTREVIGSVLNVLVEYTVNHFHREERLMELGGYPDREAHIELHRTLTARVRDFQQQYAGGRHGAVDELFEFLKDWLTGHIIAVDKRYKPYVETVELTPSDLAGTFGDAESEGEDGTTSVR